MRVLTKYKRALYLCLLVLVTTAVYRPVLKNQLTNWDDNVYITDNPLVRDLSLRGLGKIWKTMSFSGNYHPLTLSVIVLEYRYFKDSPAPYHAVSMILHIINTLLVFWLILLLFHQIEIALIAGLLFGVHPLHVESVAWAAEQKDLLYSLFYLSGLIIYTFYLNEVRKRGFYILSLFLFVCSLLSKSMAVMFPIHLLLFDYWQSRKMDSMALIEKIPYLLLSLGFGIVAIFSQSTGGALTQQVGWLKNIMVAAHGLLFYPIKMVAPFSLSAFYPYPINYSGWYPWTYIISPLIVAFLLWVLLKNRKRWSVAFWASGFYLISVIPVLQLIPVGGAVAADRYVYLASLGFFTFAGYGIHKLWVNMQAYRYARQLIIALVVLSICLYGFLSRQRVKIWYNSLVLWNNVTEKYPESARAYNNRGSAWRDLGYFNEAEEDYSMAIKLDPLYAMAYGTRGDLRFIMGEPYLALEDYQKVINLDSLSFKAFNNRGYVHLTIGQHREAFDDFNKAISINPKFVDAFYNRSIVYGIQGNNDSMLKDLNQVLTLDAGYWMAYLDRGRYFLSVHEPQKALDDYNKALTNKANEPAAYLGRGRAYGMMGMFNQARVDLEKAILLDDNDPDAHFYLAMCYYSLGNIESAKNYIVIAESLGYVIPQEFKRQLPDGVSHVK